MSENEAGSTPPPPITGIWWDGGKHAYRITPQAEGCETPVTKIELRPGPGGWRWYGVWRGDYLVTRVRSDIVEGIEYADAMPKERQK